MLLCSLGQAPGRTTHVPWSTATEEWIHKQWVMFLEISHVQVKNTEKTWKPSLDINGGQKFFPNLLANVLRISRMRLFWAFRCLVDFSPMLVWRVMRLCSQAFSVEWLHFRSYGVFELCELNLINITCSKQATGVYKQVKWLGIHHLYCVYSNFDISEESVLKNKRCLRHNSMQREKSRTSVLLSLRSSRNLSCDGLGPSVRVCNSNCQGSA